MKLTPFEFTLPDGTVITKHFDDLDRAETFAIKTRALTIKAWGMVFEQFTPGKDEPDWDGLVFWMSVSGNEFDPEPLAIHVPSAYTFSFNQNKRTTGGHR